MNKQNCQEIYVIDERNREREKPSRKRPSVEVGGIDTAAKILNSVSCPDADSILIDLKQLDPELASSVIERMVRFEELALAETRSLQTLVRASDSNLLMVALTGLSRDVRDPFLRAMSNRARNRFISDMETLGPVRRSDLEKARAEIVKVARELRDQGKFMFAKAGYIA